MSLCRYQQLVHCIFARSNWSLANRIRHKILVVYRVVLRIWDHELERLFGPRKKAKLEFLWQLLANVFGHNCRVSLSKIWMQLLFFQDLPKSIVNFLRTTLGHAYKKTYPIRILIPTPTSLMIDIISFRLMHVVMTQMKFSLTVNV